MVQSSDALPHSRSCLPMKGRNCLNLLKQGALALRHGGLSVRSATRHSPAACWASWADALRARARRNPDFAHEVAGSLASDRPLPLALQSARDARAALSAIGFEPPAWAELLALPSHLPAQTICRLRLPLPLASARCRCHAHLDPCGDLPALRHFAGQGGPLERAAARVCTSGRAKQHAYPELCRSLPVHRHTVALRPRPLPMSACWHGAVRGLRHHPPSLPRVLSQPACCPLPLTGTANVDWEVPPLSDVLADSPSQPPLVSGTSLP